MKRNLFAIFLAVMLIAALVIVAAPSAKAEASDVTKLLEDHKEPITIDENTILDLAGYDATVSVNEGVTLSVIDTSYKVFDNTSNDYTIDFSGDRAGKLTVAAESAGTIVTVSQHGDYRYLMVENTDEKGNSTGTYSFHPFNMAISRRGINVKMKTVSLEAMFVANDIVRGMITDFGVCKMDGDVTGYFSAKPKFDFNAKYDGGENGNNGAIAYYDLTGSLEKAALAEERTFCAYIKIGDTVIKNNQKVDVTPKTVLTNINENFDKFTPEQKTMMAAMVKGTEYLETLCNNFAKFEPTTEPKGESLIFEGNKDYYTLDPGFGVITNSVHVTYTDKQIKHTYANIYADVSTVAEGKKTVHVTLRNNASTAVTIQVQVNTDKKNILKATTRPIAAGDTINIDMPFEGDVNLLYFFIGSLGAADGKLYSGDVTISGIYFE